MRCASASAGLYCDQLAGLRAVDCGKIPQLSAGGCGQHYNGYPVPILDGQISVVGRTDMARLSSGELVFTGVLRTNLAAIVQTVPVAGSGCGVASEYFAVSGDVHLILGHLRPQDYTCATPDGQSPSLDSARRRLARLVCADIEMLSAEEIDGMAQYIYAQQVHQIREGLSQVLSRLPGLREHPVVVLGTGAFLGIDGCEEHGSGNRRIYAGYWDPEELAVLPCVAAAQLLAEHLKGYIDMSLDAVLKIGGSLSRGNGLEVLCREIRRLGERYRLLVVPGGGEFADQVRDGSTTFQPERDHRTLHGFVRYGSIWLPANHLIPGSVLTADLPSRLPGDRIRQSVGSIAFVAGFQDSRLPTFLEGYLRYNLGVGGAPSALPHGWFC